MQTLTTELRLCPYCINAKPLSEFNRRGNGNYRTECKPCRSRIRKGERMVKATPEHIKLIQYMDLTTATLLLRVHPMKVCTECDLLLDLNLFGPDSKGMFGKRNVCFVCHAMKNMKWREENPERQKAAEDAWYERNPGYPKIKKQRRRARERDLWIEDVYESDLILRDGPLCSFCGEAPELIHVDHFWPLDLDGYNCRENMLISCSTCNTQKGAKEPQAFINRQIRLGRKVQLSDRVVNLLSRADDMEYQTTIRRLG